MFNFKKFRVSIFPNQAVVRRLKQQTPNFISFLSLLSGLSAIYEFYHNNIRDGFLMIFFAAVFDLLDGRVARRLNVASRFGAILDSVVDFCNYGLSVGIILCVYWFRFYNITKLFEVFCIFTFITLLYVYSIGKRLINFTRNPATQSEYFIGLPSPVAGVAMLVQFFFINERVVSSFYAAGIPVQTTFLLGHLLFLLLLTYLPCSSIRFWSTKNTAGIGKALLELIKRRYLLFILLTLVALYLCYKVDIDILIKYISASVLFIYIALGLFLTFKLKVW